MCALFESLESRVQMSVSLSGGVLTVLGTAWNDVINARPTLIPAGMYGFASYVTIEDNGAVSSYPWGSVSRIVLAGGDGNDRLSGDAGLSKPMDLYGGPGNDTVTGGRGADWVDGGDGDDLLTGNGGNDGIWGGNGVDTASFTGVSTPLMISLDDVPNDTGDGTDNVCSNVENVIGGTADDVIVGNAFNNRLEGGGGNDVVYGLDGNDVLYGGVVSAGVLYSAVFNKGNDIVLGGNGDDVLFASYDGNCALYGEAGNDALYGGNGADYLRGDAGNDLLAGGSNNDRLDGSAGNDTAYGQDGDDLLHGNDGNDWLSGDGGQDKLYGDLGADVLTGGDGNDTLMTIGGGQTDYLAGNGGFDSFWADSESTEVVADADSFEVGHGNVHRVSGFMDYHQAGYVTGTFGLTYKETWLTVDRDPHALGTDMADPVNAPNLRNFSGQPLFAAGGPSRNDIDQGALGDCYFLAPLSSVADVDPNQIRQTVVEMGDGTYAVQFFSGGTPYFVRVDGDLPTDGMGNLFYAGYGVGGSIWAPIVEKAWACARFFNADYSMIASGLGYETYDALGCPNTMCLFLTGAPGGGDSIFEYLQAELAAGKAVTVGTSDPSAKLVARHEYMVVSAYTDLGGTRRVVLRNPWGGAAAFVEVSADELAGSANRVYSAWTW